MQKQKKQFVIILILLIVCAGAFLGVRYYNQKQEEKEKAEEEAETITVTDLETDAITAFSYYLDGEQLSFTKSGEDWIYDGDAAIDMDESTIDSMLSAAASLTAEDEINGADDLSEYGLDQPSNTIVLATAEGAVTLYLGDKNTILSEYYLKTDASDTVYLVSASLSSQFNKTIGDLTAVAEETEAVTEETEAITEETETAAEGEGTEETEAVTEAEIEEE